MLRSLPVLSPNGRTHVIAAVIWRYHLKLKSHLWEIIYGTVLTVFTVYLLLDTFVITRVYTPAAPLAPSNNTQWGENGNGVNHSDFIGPTQPQITDTSYTDANISVSITKYREKETDIYVADVRLSSPAYLKTALANNQYGKNVKAVTSETAKNVGAIFAVNGDYYGARESGYVLRNGTLYRNVSAKDQEDLVIYGDGSFEIINENDVTAEELLNRGAFQVMSFGPALLTNGEISVDEDEEVGRAKASNPRTAVAIVDDLHYLFIVSDGRTDESHGLTLYELAGFIKSLGAKTSYNLDGGGSSTMYFEGKVINVTTDDGKNFKERKVSDIVYIGY